MTTLLASSPTLDGITDAIERFHMGEPRALKGDDETGYIVLDHLNQEIEGLRVIKKGKRYRFESV
jgi:hypothetical protein